MGLESKVSMGGDRGLVAAPLSWYAGEVGREPATENEGVGMDKDEALLDVFTTAIESGVGYWFRVDSYKWKDMGKDWFATGVISDEGDATFRIDRKVILRGIERAFADREKFTDNYQRLAIDDLHHGNWENLDYDAITADVIVQYGLFNECVFG